MNQEAQSIAKQIQELENLQNMMLESAHFNYDIFEKRYQQIMALESQQRKLADEAKPITQRNNWYKPSLEKQQMIDNIKVLPKDEHTKVFNEAKKLSRNNTPEFKHFAQAYTNLLEQKTNKPQPRSRLSSSSTVSSFSNSPKRNTLTQLNKNSQLQRPLSASSLRSNVSIKPHQRQLKRQASEILINKGSSNSRYFYF